MNEIIFYNKDGSIKESIELNIANIEKIHGMITKCTMKNGNIEIGYSDVYRCKSSDYTGKVNEYIDLWTWDNLDEVTHQLNVEGNDRYNQTFNKIKIDGIKKIECILNSNPRWGGKLTNKFEFIKNEDSTKFNIPDFLKKSEN